jgi:MFS family permease
VVSLVAGNGKKLHYAWFILIGCCFIQAGGLGGVINTAGVFLVPICDEMGFGRAEFALWLTLLYMSSSIAMPFIARILNERNFKIILNGTLLVTIVAFASAAFFAEVWQWYIIGLIIGIIGSFNFICLSPILLENWFYKKTGTAVGIAMACAAGGGAIFSILGTAIISAIGWRGAYLLIAAIVFALCMPWALFVFRFKPSDKGLLPYGYEESGADARAARPLEAGVPLKRALFTFAFVALFIFAGEDALFGGFNSNIPGFAISVGLTEFDGANMLSLGMIGCVVFSVLMGMVADRFGIEKPTYISFVVVAISLLGFIFIKNPILLYINAFIFGMSGVGIAVCVPLLVEKMFGKRNYAEILAMTRMGTGIIGSFGPTLIALSFDRTGNYTVAFIGGIIALATCRLLVFAAIKSSKKIPWDKCETSEISSPTQSKPL